MNLYELLFYDNSVILLFLSTSLMFRYQKILHMKFGLFLMESTTPGWENSCVMSSVTVDELFNFEIYFFFKLELQIWVVQCERSGYLPDREGFNEIYFSFALWEM